MLDLQAEQKDFDLRQTQQMQMMKTGALMSCAVICGGIVGGASPKLLAAQTLFAQHLGLAFQIADDLLDYAGDASVMGKPAGQDANRGKAGFVALIGLRKHGRWHTELLRMQLQNLRLGKIWLNICKASRHSLLHGIRDNLTYVSV